MLFRTRQAVLFLGFSPIFFSGGNTPADVPLSFVFLQHLFDLEKERAVEGGQTFAEILMDGGFAHAKPLCRRAHRRLVLYDVKRQPAGALLNIPFQTATLPAIVWASFLLHDLYA